MSDEINKDIGKTDAEDQITQSKKPEVIEIVYDRLIGGDTWPVKRRLVVDRSMLEAAIKERNRRHVGERKPLSTGNVANFLKDFIRKKTCNRNWPRRLLTQRITARQVYGNEQVFEFVEFSSNDTVPFPDRFDPTPELPVIRFESLSIPLEARKLGRQDEPWLIQIAVSQRLIETHLSTRAVDCGLLVETLAHLQVSVKTQPEIDATFIATLRTFEGKRIRTYVTVEAKQIGERILEHQVREQVGVAFSFTSRLNGEDAIDAILPIVIQVVRKPEDFADAANQYVYVAQFNMIGREEFDKKYSLALHDMPLTIQSAALYEAFPPISGISNKPKRAVRPRRVLST
ncbi:hypothetical protein GOC87_03775 [Sinorhizobium meliloti]|uniref:hypothetical protein n=1 Tax=Rhizobium meliloti TaxID=382 RepID=UPI000B49F7F7|nr:hypothetical protein [Sinorhizobium meliloti]ASQ02357.1 hypothetical protein CDO24_34930 [Sinorhizobium meliloti]MDW9702776.1 hypothetical protein [Sinorhizobium meliloti]MDW9932946.1 hypothetical protein [Sinorhizobium meliloti]MDX0098725.1 hypothetical protein [Sinorhizobium meliloti]MDX0117376.1 hypothetical protein [Sinorhizobium meliloti]